MRLLSDLCASVSLWCNRLFRRACRERFDREMAEEMRTHLDAQTQRNLASGMSESDACAAARRQFGGVAQIEEHARDEQRRGLLWLENLWRDAGFAARTLGKSPGYTAVVVLTLALGIGVNSALFTWFNAAAFRPLPVPDPGQLFTLQRVTADGFETKSMSYPDFVAYRDHQTVFSGLAAAAGRNVELLDGAGPGSTTAALPVELRLETVSTNYFAVFGVPMALGRPLVAADATSTSALPVIVLSHQFWQSHFGGDPAVIGRTLRVHGLTEEALSIVGVSGPEFFGTRPGALAGWVPLLMRPGDAWRTDLKATSFRLTGRLRPGISREQAAEELTVIANALLARPRTGPAVAESIALTRASTYIEISAQLLPVLLPMVGLFGAVLLVACANASNLILARTVTRQFEFAVRGALGASRRRLFALLITESLMLGVLGGLAGWGVAAGLLQFAWPWLLDMMPGAREGTAGLNLHADYRVLVFTLAVSLLAGAAGGLLPGLHVTRRDVGTAIKGEGSAFGRRLRVSRVRNLLAVGQLALSAALLFTAGLLVHRALRMQFQDAGFDKAQLLTFEVLAPRTHPPGQVDAARRQVQERLRTLPEVAAICELPRFPFSRSGTKATVPSVDQRDGRTIETFHSAVPAGYFATLRLPLIRGRAFSTDEMPSDRVAVISETAARVFWPGEDALGKSFDVPAQLVNGNTASATASTVEASSSRATLTVIGIVRDVRIHDPQANDLPSVYLPLAPQAEAAPFLLIRTRDAARLSVPTLQQVGREVTGIAPRIMTVEELSALATVQYRVIAWVAGILAALSLLVAVIGLYGVMSFAVNQRVKEIGVRIALGASPGRVVSGIVRESLRLVGVGAIVGYGLSVAITQVAQSLLFGLSALDPLACGLVTLFLAAVGVFACWMPARRAAKVDPVVALRTE